MCRSWSRSIPRDDSLPGTTQALKFDAAAFDALDAEIRAILKPKDLITPDDVQGNYPTLRDAVLKHGWPTLAASRGRLILALDEEGEKVALYRGPRKSLEGRAMFVNVPEDSPAAAYLTLNEALSDTAHIAAAVRAGFLVRTRADATRARRARTTRTAATPRSSPARNTSRPTTCSPTRASGLTTARMPDGTIAACNPVRAKCEGKLE